MLKYHSTDRELLARDKSSFQKVIYFQLDCFIQDTTHQAPLEALETPR